MKSKNQNILKILQDPEKIHKALQSAIYQALLQHKQAGNPVCEMRNGKIVWIQPEDIVIPGKNNKNGKKF